ncbi:OPT family oligopeptide transporter [candidate division KSB1 bacterium]
MEESQFKPYVPEETDLKEFTLKALLVGIFLAVLLGAANAYLGLRAGMTVAATFPAAVVSMAILRVFNGSILEENLSRTTASVGEALVAGAIFTIPAFVLAGVWENVDIWETMMIMMVGGVLGVLFVIVLRRSLVTSPDLPFPESVACAEMVKAGQKGATGAGYVFGAAGFAALIELFKNSRGLQFISEYKEFFTHFSPSKMNFLLENSAGQNIQQSFDHEGGMYYTSPSASPAFIGVGYIIGPRLSSITFSGGVFGWLLLIPLLMYINNSLGMLPGVIGGSLSDAWMQIGNAVWYYQVRPIAVGAMLVGAVYALWNMRNNLKEGIGKAIKDVQAMKVGGEVSSRIDQDLPFNRIISAIVILVIPMAFLYYYFSQNVIAAIVAALVMVVAGFLFAAVAGYLVGIIGSSSNPISGLTLSTLLIGSILMVFLGMSGDRGIAAVLGVAAVVCCSLGVAGDMMQDLKVGHLLGGTPRKMEWAEIIGVIFAAAALPLVLYALHAAYTFGSPDLPAPQAGLMAMIAQGVVNQEMAWPLIIAGMFFAVGLIMIKSPSPMLIAVGMYLPFHTTFAIFVGGGISWIYKIMAARRNLDKEKRKKADNTGLLVASGFVAGESLMGVILAFIVLSVDRGWFNVTLPSARTGIFHVFSRSQIL